jgi:hypothetical protein
MWYNIVPSFVPMDPNVYSMYYLGIKGLYPLISRGKKGDAIDVTQPKLVPPIEQLVQNQYFTRIPNFRLEQSILTTKGVPIQ